MATSSPDADALRAAGLRVTRPRLAVLATLREARSRGEHLAAADVAARARRRIGALSTQAAYDCLDALVGAGLARRTRPADAASATYEARVGDNHHHLVCRRCGTTADVDCTVGAAPCLLPAPAALPPGFVLDEAEVTFWGTCAACAPPAAAPPGDPTSQTPAHRTSQEETRD
ncbi:Fur family transcriptional regulator [Quadrisphaera sp. DSM 44207]|uniref:Fur family transcriptional regulator n=1 Tax=Quadrisphaera sp. DSM 44207 TaxID=1881057 RepID=UPI0008867220|nr:transcriptional repressor [Quadrisphaera sp. DSM 44207]SDQ85993.1 Fur family transcriptional regulator, ferric uptake regulator [Quadrisphaera sp. DSM 44207]